MKARKINRRADEPENARAYQVTFRTTARLSGAWSSLRGLCRKYGHDELTPELFAEVVLPAMRRYVSERGYLDAARAARSAAGAMDLEAEDADGKQ